MAPRKTDTALPPHMDLGGEDDGVAPALSTRPVGMPRLTIIVVEESEDIPPTGLPLGLNGKAFIIRPGEEVRVPDGVLEILDHARKSVPKIDSVTRRIAGWSERPRFPYRIIRQAA